MAAGSAPQFLRRLQDPIAVWGALTLAAGLWMPIVRREVTRFDGLAGHRQLMTAAEPSDEWSRTPAEGLQATLICSGERMAVVDGKTIRAGDSIVRPDGTWRVDEIGSGRIVLASNSSDQRIEMTVKDCWRKTVGPGEDLRLERVDGDLPVATKGRQARIEKDVAR